MDLLITNKDGSIKLSDKGIITTDFDESSPSLRPLTKSFNGRNGKLFFDSDYDTKKLSYSGYLTTTSQFDYEATRNWLYKTIGRSEPFYITPILSGDSQYDYEFPGQSTGNRLGQTNGVESNKRFFVTVSDTLAPQFVGSVNGKQIHKIELTFETVDLPFGETKPKTMAITNKIAYAGTVAASQLEVPFYIKLTSQQTASAISLKIGSRTWTYSGTVAAGDMFLIGGMYNLKNNLSVNDNTNFEYFVLEPSASGQIAVSSSISATIEIHDYKELYL